MAARSRGTRVDARPSPGQGPRSRLSPRGLIEPIEAHNGRSSRTLFQRLSGTSLALPLFATGEQGGVREMGSTNRLLDEILERTERGRDGFDCLREGTGHRLMLWGRLPPQWAGNLALHTYVVA